MTFIYHVGNVTFFTYDAAFDHSEETGDELRVAPLGVKPEDWEHITIEGDDE